MIRVTPLFAVVLLGACLHASSAGEGLGAWGKVKHQVKTLRAKACSKREAVKRGDSVQVLLATAAKGTQKTGEETSYGSSGAAAQNFIVGRHAIPPLNKGILGMCVGEMRRISVTFGKKRGMDYVVELVEKDVGPARLKDATL
mmetsp:Transcript_110523/g.180299  ORF Transcript_110523/g.180299 Transcript_110523/m.180299 type:complete len:143 (-) Transcript_110523:97-525(-)